MAGKPQTLSQGQKEEVVKILRKQVVTWILVGLALLTSITGLSLWGIKNRLEKKMENLVAKQFEEPRIKSIVGKAAEGKAKELMAEQINPEVERFKDDIASKLAVLQSLVEDTKNLKSKSDENAKLIEGVLASVQRSQVEVDKVKNTITGINSNLVELERGLVEIQYYTYKGRNSFPNPYHDKIMKKLNELLIIAVPNHTERATFIKEIEAYQPNKRREN